jgi:hypothetical protein
MPHTGTGVKLSDLVCHLYVTSRSGLIYFRSIDSSFSSRLVEALKESTLHRAFFLKLSSSIDPKTSEKWEADVTTWEDDQSKPNPFAEAKNRT